MINSHILITQSLLRGFSKDEKYVHYLDNLYIIINKSDDNFVIPYSCVFNVKVKNSNDIVYGLPISSRVVILLYPKAENDNFKVIEVQFADKNDVKEINSNILKTEIKNENKYIIGYEKDLIFLKENS